MDLDIQTALHFITFHYPPPLKKISLRLWAEQLIKVSPMFISNYIFVVVLQMQPLRLLYPYSLEIVLACSLETLGCVSEP